MRINLLFTLDLPNSHLKVYGFTRPPTSSLGMQRLLQDLHLASSSDDIDEYWTKWSQIFMSAMHRCIPCKSNTPLIIRSSIKKRWSLYHRFKRSKCHDWLVKYRSLRNSIVNQIRQAKKDFFIKLANSRSDPKAFWATITKLQPRTSSPSVLSNESATATLDLDKANLFNQYITSCFNPKCVSPSYSSMDTEDVGFMDSFDVVPDEVAVLLQRTKAHFASGPDGISAWMLRSFADSLSPSIASMFNSTWETTNHVEGVPCCPT